MITDSIFHLLSLVPSHMTIARNKASVSKPITNIHTLFISTTSIPTWEKQCQHALEHPGIAVSSAKFTWIIIQSSWSRYSLIWIIYIILWYLGSSVHDNEFHVPCSHQTHQTRLSFCPREGRSWVAFDCFVSWYQPGKYSCKNHLPPDAFGDFGVKPGLRPGLESSLRANIKERYNDLDS